MHADTHTHTRNVPITEPKPRVVAISLACLSMPRSRDTFTKFIKPVFVPANSNKRIFNFENYFPKLVKTLPMLPTSISEILFIVEYFFS